MVDNRVTILPRSSMEENQEEEDCFRMLSRFIMEENQDDKYELPPLAEGPWLIATHENQKWNKLEKQTFRTNTNLYIKTIPELDRNIIVDAHQDWLILRDREDWTIYSLWNPVTSQFLQLPELLLEEDIQPSVCLLTSSLDLVNNPETCLLVLFFDGGLMFSCRPTTSQDCSWVKQCNELDGSVFEINMAATLEGVIYAQGYPLSRDGAMAMKFVCMKNVNNGSSSSLTMEPMNIEVPHTKIDCGFMGLRSYKFMVESCGVLYYIAMITLVVVDDDDNNKSGLDNLDIIKVLIWKLDFTHMHWIQVESLRNRAFLLGTNCTWCWAAPTSLQGETFIEENCIYLARPDDDNKVYSYNLNDDSYTILLSYPSFLKSYYGPTWFTAPDHQGPFSGPDGNRPINEISEQIDDINQEFQERVEEPQEMPSGTLLFELPLDILQSIAKRMNLFDYMNLRLTCKRFYEVNPISQWRSKCRYPLFMFLKDSSGTYELLDPFENISRPILIPHIPPISSIEYCKDGWLLVQCEQYSLRYMYPFSLTPDTSKYPRCYLDMTRIGFSTCPTSSDSLTVAISGFTRTQFGCFEAVNGEWVYYDMDFDPDTDIKFRTNYKIGPKYHNNAFYFLGKDGCLGEFKFLQGETTWHVYKHPFTEDEDTVFDSGYLVELDGELISVFIKEVGRCLQVFKFDLSNKCWIELDTLGEHILFLSSASSYSLKADKSEMANRIYLPRRFGDGIVFYSLDTRTYHTSGSADSRQDLSGTKAQLSCCWLW